MVSSRQAPRALSREIRRLKFLYLTFQRRFHGFHVLMRRLARARERSGDGWQNRHLSERKIESQAGLRHFSGHTTARLKRELRDTCDIYLLLTDDVAL